MDALTIFLLIYLFYCIFSGDWKQALWRIAVFMLFCVELYFFIGLFMKGFEVSYLLLGVVTSYFIGFIMVNIFTSTPNDLDRYPDPSFLDSFSIRSYRGPALLLLIGLLNVPFYILVTILWQRGFRR